MARADGQLRKGYRGIGMEGPIARWYARTAGRDQHRYRDKVAEIVELLPDGGAVLEVAPGPGYLSIALAKAGDGHAGYTVTGLDISATFVEIASGNAADAAVPVEFRRGDAAAMPFADGVFDVVVCCAAFKNFADPVGALREMHRVLRRGGVARISDLRRDVSKQDIEREVAGMGLGVVNRLFVANALRFWLAKRAYTASEFERFAERTDFSSCQVRPVGTSLEVTLRR